MGSSEGCRGLGPTVWRCRRPVCAKPPAPSIRQCQTLRWDSASLTEQTEAEGEGHGAPCGGPARASGTQACVMWSSVWSRLPASGRRQPQPRVICRAEL